MRNSKRKKKPKGMAAAICGFFGMKTVASRNGEEHIDYN